jgi:uncharacterized RDD family membrane protein YckC
LLFCQFFYVFFSFNDNIFNNSFLTTKWFIIKNRWILISVWNKWYAFICRKQPEMIPTESNESPNKEVRDHVVVITVLFVVISLMFFYVFFSFNDNIFNNSFLTTKWFIIEYRWILICVWNKRCASICRQASHSNWIQQSPSPEDEVRDHVVVITVLFVVISLMFFYVFFSFNDNIFNNSFLTREWFIIQNRWILICVWNKRHAFICRQQIVLDQEAENQLPNNDVVVERHLNLEEQNQPVYNHVRIHEEVGTVFFIVISSMPFLYFFHSLKICSIICYSSQTSFLTSKSLLRDRFNMNLILDIRLWISY